MRAKVCRKTLGDENKQETLGEVEIRSGNWNEHRRERTKEKGI